MLEEGLRAYADEQADLEEQRAARWEKRWGPIRSHAERMWEKALGSVEVEDIEPLNVELEVEDTDEALLGIDWGAEDDSEYD